MESNRADRAGYDPHDALADVATTRAAIADRLITPWWYHTALGAILAALVVVGALDLHNAIRLPVALGCAVGIGMLVTAYQCVTGLWVDVRNLGPVSARWWALYAVPALVIVGASLLPSLTHVSFSAGVAASLAAAIFLGTIVLGRKMDAALRAEIRSGAATAPEARR